MNCGLDRNHENMMCVFFTAFVWGSTYTTHKNAKIYRYSWLFAYYRRELWERSCISVLKKNRSFQIPHTDHRQLKPEQMPIFLGMLPVCPWSTDSGLVLAKQIWLTQNHRAGKGSLQNHNKHTAQNCFLWTAENCSKRSPVPSTSDLPSHRFPHLYTIETSHSHGIWSFDSSQR